MIFVDTAAWAAVALSNDRYHKAAARFQQGLRKTKEYMLTSNFVLDETYTLLLYQSNYDHAIRFYNHIQIMMAGNILKISHVSEEIEGEAWHVFQKFNVDKHWSFTDCTSKIIMENSQIREVFTFDHHFQQMGFLCFPGGVA